MEFGAIGRMIHGLAPVLVLPLLGSLAVAESPKSSDYLKNIELCNGTGRTSFTVRIAGCAALIDSGQGTTTSLAIAFSMKRRASSSMRKRSRTSSFAAFSTAFT